MLEIENLSATYGGITALRNVSMTVPEKSIVALLGSNGAGKSTLLSAMMGVMEGEVEGRVLLDGVDITTLSSEKIVAMGLALVPEGRDLFGELTVEENLSVGAYLRRDKPEIAADLEKVFVLFPKLKERRRQVAETLSGGEQQMVAIGRALMSRPKFLLLDEPCLGLAPIFVTEIMRYIQQINQSGTTILLIEQNVRQALSISTTAYVLEKGEVRVSGTAEELMNDAEVASAYLGR